MPQLHLTSRSVAALKLAAEGQIEYWDTILKGFGVRLSKRGESALETKTFFVRYRVGKRMRRLTIGDASTIPLADARAKARAALVAIDDGKDPAVVRSAERRAWTFGDLWREYMERHAKQKKRSWRDDLRIGTTELLPQWEDRKAHDVTRRDVRQLLDAIVDRGAPVMANRTLALARKVFNFGLERELVESNPCHKAKAPGQEQSRERVLNDDEIRAFWQALEREEQAGRYLTANLFRVRLLTAQRGSEVLRMRWADLSEESRGGFWTIPKDVTKNRRSHRVPLSGPVIAILTSVHTRQEEQRQRANQWRQMKGQPLREATAWVFPSPRGTAHVSNTFKAFDRLRQSCGSPDYTPHDLRRTVSTKMTGDLKIPRFTVGRILNHGEPGVTKIYDRYAYDDEKRDALDRWAQYLITGILKGESSSRVLTFRSGS